MKCIGYSEQVEHTWPRQSYGCVSSLGRLEVVEAIPPEGLK